VTAPSLVIVATSFNRRAMTVAALRDAQRSAQHSGVAPQVVLVDAGSSDGTPDAVRTELSDVEVVSVTPDHYWAQGMRIAMTRAIATAPDYLLWLNDDTLLFESAVATLLSAAASTPRGAIVVGAVRDATTGERTYGGWVNTSRWGLRFSPAPVEAGCVPCDAVNGNIVLVAREVYQRIGVLDAGFTHSMADYDYSLRARQADLPVLQAPGFVATCSRNPRAGGWKDRSLSLSQRVRLMRSPKGLPPREWARFQFRHGGLSGPTNIIRPWVGLVVDEVRRRLRQRSSAPIEPRGQGHL
jgi:GT2 family glycosyltransferase